jgi:cardiolipin synthase
MALPAQHSSHRGGRATTVLTYIFEHLLTISGFLLAVILLTKVFRESRRPGGAIAWVLAIVLIPYVGVPLYLLIGGRKVRRMARRKSSLFTRGYGGQREQPEPKTETERVLTSAHMAPIRRHNAVDLHFGGESAYEELMRLLESAQHSIHAMTFILGRDEVGRAIVDVLARKAAQGLEVRFLLDSLGCMWSQGHFCDPIRQAGGKVGVFMPVLPLRRKSSANLRNHRKIVVVDDESAMVGGMNMATNFMGPGSDPARFLDSAVFVRGPAVADIQAIFAGDWHYATDETFLVVPPELEPPEMAGSAVQVVASGPDVPEDVFHDALLTSIMHAEERVWMVTPYFVPDDPIVKALTIQAKTGRDVRLIIPKRSNHLIPDVARGPYLRRLIEAGARVYAFPRMVHAKVLLFDDNIAVTGSPNLDMRSMYLNFEIALFHYSRPEIEQTEHWIGTLIDESEQLRFETVGIVREWAENLSIIVSPLL